MATTTLATSEQMDLGPWSEAVAAVVAAFVGAAGMWAKGRHERRQKKLETDASVERARIEADNSTDLKMLDALMVRVRDVEKRNDRQDEKIERLTLDNAELGARLTVAREQLAAEREQNILLREANELLRVEIGLLKER